MMVEKMMNMVMFSTGYFVIPLMKIVILIFPLYLIYITAKIHLVEQLK